MSFPNRSFSVSLTDVLPPPCRTSDLSRPSRREVYTRGPSGPLQAFASASFQRFFIRRLKAGLFGERRQFYTPAMLETETKSWEEARDEAGPIRFTVFV